MPHMKGFTNNPNGRPKGSQNKATADLRDWLTDFVQGQRDQIVSDWQALEPKDRIVMFEKLMKFVLPTLSATTLQSQFDRLPDDQLEYLLTELKQQSAA